MEARRGGGVRVSSTRVSYRAGSSYRAGTGYRSVSVRASPSIRYSSTRIRVRTSHRSFYSGYNSRWYLYGSAGYVYGYHPYTRRTVYINYNRGKTSIVGV